MYKIILGCILIGALCMGTAYAQGKAAACINVDTATAKGLQKLKGVGPALAKSIIDHRKAQRAMATKAKKKKWMFNNWKTLLMVKGVGHKLCTENVGRVCFADKKVAQKTCPKPDAAKGKMKDAAKGKKKGK